MSPTPERGSEGAPFTDGAYRRRLRMVITEPGVAEGGLEDDFHYFTVRVGHDGAVVTDVTASAYRWPWTTCPDAAGPLHALEGMELSARPLAAGDASSPKLNCTHMFDLASLTISHAARGGPVGTVRQYDIVIPAAAQQHGEVVVTCARDGEPLLAWTLDGRRVVAPPEFVDAPFRGGFFRWAEEAFGNAAQDWDAAEAAIVLRRACDIGMGRGMDLDAVEVADELEHQMAGVCFTMQPEQIHVAFRNKGTIKDFDEHPERALAHGPFLP